MNGVMGVLMITALYLLKLAWEEQRTKKQKTKIKNTYRTIYNDYKKDFHYYVSEKFILSLIKKEE